MATPDQTAPGSEGHDPAAVVSPAGAGATSASAGAPASRVAASERGGSGVVLLYLFGIPSAVVLLLVAVILPIWDGKKSWDSAGDTYSEFYSMSYAAGWETDSEIRSLKAALDSDLRSLDSGLWSVDSDLGSLALAVPADSRPRVRELESAIDAHRDELRRLQISTDDRFDQLRESVEVRLGELEDVAKAASDGHWDESSRRFSRDGRIILGTMWVVVAVVMALVLAGLWVAWLDRRARDQPAEGA